jgi:hypothetical protein
VDRDRSRDLERDRGVFCGDVFRDPAWGESRKEVEGLRGEVSWWVIDLGLVGEAWVMYMGEAKRPALESFVLAEVVIAGGGGTPARVVGLE